MRKSLLRQRNRGFRQTKLRRCRGQVLRVLRRPEEELGEQIKAIPTLESNRSCRAHQPAFRKRRAVVRRLHYAYLRGGKHFPLDPALPSDRRQPVAGAISRSLK